MNTDKFIANLIYVVYLVVTYILIQTSIWAWDAYMNPAPVWHAVPMAIGYFIYILITMRWTYSAMPERWRMYWRDNP